MKDRERPQPPDIELEMRIFMPLFDEWLEWHRRQVVARATQKYLERHAKRPTS